MFKKGQSGNPKGRPVGAKSRSTIEKEQRRAIFEQVISQSWEKTIEKLKPEYVADQFMGSAPKDINLRFPKPIDDVLSDISVQTNKESEQKD